MLSSVQVGSIGLVALLFGSTLASAATYAGATSAGCGEYAVSGINTSISVCSQLDPAAGVFGEAEGAYGAGVYGLATAADGAGVLGVSTSPTGYGVYASGVNAIYATTNGLGGTAVQAVAGGTAVYANSIGGNAVQAYANNSTAVLAVSNTMNAISGTNSRTDWNAAAITALAGSSTGLSYYGNGGIEIEGTAAKPGGGAWSGTSDARLKKDVADLKLGLADLLRVHTVSYKYNGLGGTTDDGTERVGVLAQELETVFPRMVSSRSAKMHPGDAEETDIKQVDPSDFTYILIKSVQEQEAIIERQDARIRALESARSPASGGLGGAGAGLGLLVAVGAVVGARRRRSGEESGPISA